jgi:DNA polymerase
MNRIKLNCNNNSCPVFTNCGFLPTIYFKSHKGVNVCFVGQGGGKTERAIGIPFCGDAGQRLTDLVYYCRTHIKDFGFAFTNTIRDCPKNNREPKQNEFNQCKKYLKRDIQYLKDTYNLKIIIALGNSTKKLLLNINDSMKRCHGKIHKFKDLVIMPTYHPSAMIRNNTIFNHKELQGYEVDFVNDMKGVLKLI